MGDRVRSGETRIALLAPRARERRDGAVSPPRRCGVPHRRRPTTPAAPRSRRGVALLPSLFTMGNMFCGYACVIYAMRGEFETAAPFIGIAVVLDMLDGRIARLTGTASEFGVQFDSLADIISFGMAPAVLTFAWGLARSVASAGPPRSCS